jgi:YVTN family beta-propeller protein
MAVPGRLAGKSKDTATGMVEFSRVGSSDVSRTPIQGKYSRILKIQGIAGAAVLLAALAGCGETNRPVVNPVRPTGPSPAPEAFVLAITQPDGAAAGIATVLDFSGDTILAQATIGSYPLDFTLDGPGSSGYTIDRDGSLSVIPITASLQTKTVLTSTLTASAVPFNAIVGTGNLYVIDQSSNEIDVLTGTPPGLKQAIQFPAGLINMAGRSTSPRFYAISQNTAASTTAGGANLPSLCATPANAAAAGVTGVVSALEAATNTISATIPVGVCPVYGVASADNLRAFILNRGSGTVTVVDAQKNTPDTQLNPTGTLTVPAGPVYAELYDTTSQLVTANYDSNTISVIDVSTDAFDNDSPQFGTTHNVTVGNGPSSVTVLQDGSRAYVANSKDGTVSVVNLSSFTVEKTIILPLNQDGSTPHPRMVASSFNYPTGKVYVSSPDSENLVILRTDTDTVSTVLQLQGNLIDTRVARQNANGSTQINNVSNSPGNGVPCTPGTVPASTQLVSTKPNPCSVEASVAGK